MSDWDGRDEQPEREIFAARLTPRPGPDGINPVAAMLAAHVRNLLASTDAKRIQKGKREMPHTLKEGLPELTATALGAVEGTLKSKGLEGALKEAQIIATYAEARERDANANKAEAETERVRIATAREKLALLLDTVRALGIDPAVALSQTGYFGVLLGDDLANDLSTATGVGEVGAGVEPDASAGGDE